MTVPKAWMRSAIEPAIAVLYFVLWGTASAGRMQSTDIWLFAAYWAPLLLICVGIGLSRLLPWVSMGGVAALFLLQWIVVDARFTNDAWAVYGGVLLAIIGLASTPGRLPHRLALPFGAVSGALVALFLLDPALGPRGTHALLTDWPLTEPGVAGQLLIWGLAGAAAGVGGWFIGHAIYSLDARAALEAARLEVELNLVRAESELQTIRERDTIAQDVHDIMAHSLSVIIAQADGARYLADTRGVEARDSLVAIAESARESLVEVRMLIDSLASEPEGHSAPGLADIPALVERMRAAGLTVETTTSGEPGSLTASQQIAVYRIVQESLTNAMKHAGRNATASLVLAWEPNGVQLTIRSKGIEPTSAVESARRGIRGMTERAKMAGGWLTAAPDEKDADVFVVTAFVPHAAAAPAVATVDQKVGSV
jgi:signal transduction histidine kinase